MVEGEIALIVMTALFVTLAIVSEVLRSRKVVDGLVNAKIYDECPLCRNLKLKSEPYCDECQHKTWRVEP